MISNKIRTYCLQAMLWLFPAALLAQQKDSTRTLEKVTVASQKKKQPFTAITPAQTLDRQTLQQINAQSVGDAARFFSGVLVKDYGGAGGLKTVSVRSLGAAHTGVNYDGVPVADVQSGQIDLSKYSVTFVQSIDLQQANVQSLLQPARAYGAGATLSINTISFTADALQRSRTQLGIKAGSFGLIQPFFGVHEVFAKPKLAVSLNAEVLSSKGDYPYDVENGNFSEHKRRDNAKVHSFQGELNILKQFADSSTLQVKFNGFKSKRGLPGVVIFFAEGSAQQLWNEDYYVQARYRKMLSSETGLLFSARAANNYTRYTDPAYLNNQGGLDNNYRQYEYYISGAISHHFQNNLSVSASSDAAYAKLNSNMQNFAYPTRISLWNNIALNYARSLWQVNASALLTTINDDTKTGATVSNINKLTPTIAVNGKLAANSPFMFRAFYKHVFRMPTFNDLYYRLIGNSDLRPEYARQYNAGMVYSTAIKGKLKHISVSADAYYNSIKDKIVAVPNRNLFVWTMLNLGKVNIKGLDITAEADGQLTTHTSWLTRIAYTWQQALDMTDKSSSTWKNRIPYTPDHSGSALASVRYKRWGAGYNLLFSGTRYVLGENNPFNQLDGFGVHDVFISHTIPMKKFQLDLKAELNNLTGEQYEVVRYFPMPARSYKLSVLITNL